MIKNRILLSYNLYNHLILFKSKTYVYIHIYIDKNIIGNWKYLVLANNYITCISIVLA